MQRMITKYENRIKLQDNGFGLDIVTVVTLYDEYGANDIFKTIYCITGKAH